jgi:DNA-binding beta-propeller fold protein YncE
VSTSASLGCPGFPGLYNDSGILVIATPAEEVVQMESAEHDISLYLDPHTQTLNISISTVTSNSDEQSLEYATSRANKITQRKHDMNMLQREIESKQRDLEDDEDLEIGQVGNALVCLLALKGKHRKELKLLETLEDVKVSCTRTTRVESVNLVLNQLTRVPFSDNVVMYRHGPVEITPTTVSETKDDELVSLSLWQAKQISGVLKTTIDRRDENVFTPFDIAVSGPEIFIVDGTRDLVFVYTLSGSFLRTIGLGNGSSCGEMKNPTGIAIVGDHIFVSEFSNNRVSVFDKNTSEFVRHIGVAYKSQVERLKNPHGVAVDDKYVFVAELLHARVVVYDLEGAFVDVIGSRDIDGGELSRPFKVAVSNQRVFVCDSDTNIISVFSYPGKILLYTIGEETTIDAVVFDRLVAIAVVGEILFVVDSKSERVCVLTLGGMFVREFFHRGPNLKNIKYETDSLCIAVSGEQVYIGDTARGCVNIYT